MEDIVVTPQEDSKINTLLQIIAVLLDRIGGEVVINSKEYSMYEDVPVMARTLAGGYTLLRIGDEDEESIIADPFPPEIK
jgi:hypothetical protein